MQQRLPKSRRAPEAIAAKRITERSLAIISTIARYRFILTSDIVRLVRGNEDVTHRHLQQLYHRNLVSRFTLPPANAGSEFIYFLDNAAALQQLAASSTLDASVLDLEEIRLNREKYSRSRTVGQFLFVQHELMISSFHADLEIAAAHGSSVEVERWAQGASLWNQVKNTQGRTLSHRPDALFTLRFVNAPEGQQRSNFLYEADRGTSNLTRIKEKFEAHLRFFMVGEHIKRYGIRKLRAVLVETISPERGKQMRDVAAGLAAKMPLAGMIFWFSSTEVSKENKAAFSQRWLCSADDRPRSLLD